MDGTNTSESISVLLIEDNPGDARLIQELVAEHPHTQINLLHEASLEQGLAQLKQKPVDLVLLDLSLPDSVGLNSLNRLQNHTSGTPVIVLTGLANEETAVAAVQRGAQDYLVKGDVTSSLLVRAIRYALERTKSEARVRSSETRYRRIFELSPEAIVIVNPEGFIVEANGRVYDWLGYSAEETIGSHLSELPFISAESKIAIQKNFAARMQGQEPAPYELEFITRDNKRRVGRLIASPINEDGRIIADLVLISDVTVQKRIEDSLRRATVQAQVANRAKSEFLANMSHEIRTPMNTIIGMADLLSETNLTTDQQHYVQVLQHAGDALLALINDILDLSKIETGHLDLEHVSFSLTELLKKTGNIVGFRAREKRLDLAYQLASEVPDKLVGDPTRLSQILVNLLGNAIKFTEKGYILVEIARVENSDPSADSSSDTLLARWTVTDTGIGIPHDKLEAIFESFSQASSSTTRTHGGTGLGLTICRRLVSMMGGTIHVESNVNQGSSFTFAVPLAITGSPAPSSGEPPEELRRGRVLIADPGEATRRALQHTCEAWGMETVVTDNGKEAVAFLLQAEKDAAPFSLLLLAHRLPDLGGLDLVNLIEEHIDLDRTIIILSGDQQQHEQERITQLGLRGSVIKPVFPGDLIAAYTGTPSEKEATEEISGTVPEVTGGQPVRILLADDAADNRLLIQAYLKSTSYCLDIAENGAQAVEQFQRRPADLVLMDIQMPHMDGYAATRAIREWEEAQHRAPVPVVALTAHARPEDAEKSRQAGCWDHITKPIRKKVLLEAIQRNLSAASAPTATTQESTTGHPPTPSSAQPAGQRIPVHVPAELKDLIPGFLEHRADDIRMLREAARQKDYATIRRIAHTLTGSAGGYGFQGVTEIARAMGRAARAEDGEGVTRQIEELVTYLDRVEIHYDG